FDRGFLARALPRLSSANAQGEYYLTDVLAIAREEGARAFPVPVADAVEVLGVNSKKELAEVDALLRARAAEAAMEAGATLIRPDTITLDDTVVLEPDVVVEPYASLFGATSVAKGSRIGQGAILRDSGLGAGVVVRPYCTIESSRL